MSNKTRRKQAQKILDEALAAKSLLPVACPDCDAAKRAPLYDLEVYDLLFLAHVPDGERSAMALAFIHNRDFTERQIELVKPFYHERNNTSALAIIGR